MSFCGLLGRKYELWGVALIIGGFRQTRFFLLSAATPAAAQRSIRGDGDRHSKNIATSSAPLDGVPTTLRALKHSFSNLVSKRPCGF